MPTTVPSVLRIRFLVGFAAALLASVATATAVAFPYVVQAGDSPTTLSRRVYGRVEHEKLIVSANYLQDTRSLLTGTRLDLPSVAHHRVVAGETWESLALRFLGDTRRAEALSMSNDSYPWIPVETGRVVSVPYVLRVVAGPSDTISSLAYMYMGRRDDAITVDRFNRLGGRPVKAGDVLLLPVSRLDLTDEGRALADASFALSTRSADLDTADAQRRADRELSLLEQEVSEGHWVPAVARANQLLGFGDLPMPLQARAKRALLEAYAALGEQSLAREACDDWRRADPESELDPVQLSPKILRACAGVSGGARFGNVPHEGALDDETP